MLILSISASGQNLEKKAKEITEEGIELYRSEMASWYGTDIFLQNHTGKDNLGGYFSYVDNQVPKCLFFSNNQKVIATIAFPTNYNTKDSKLDLAQRAFTKTEKNYFIIRQKTLARIKTDTIFKFYKNVNYNIVPIIKNKQRKVYVLSATNEGGKVLFGNDYLINFDRNNEITEVQRLHNSLITMPYNDGKAEKVIGGIHSHILKNWLYMTPTDICTLMLYQKFTQWEQYTTISKEFVSIWNCKTNHLTLMKTEDWEKMNQEQKNFQKENDHKNGERQ